jgi:nitrite reductase/ring-hydroxylating ferredoxin subunit
VGTTGGYLAIAGLAAGVLAAVPGAIDYRHSVPPSSSAKRRAGRHALLNLIALVVFGVAFVLRRPDWTPSLLTLTLELAGTGALGYAGWLGGTLVTRNLISVDHRHAQSGKWQEQRVTARGTDPVAVGHVDDLKADQMKLLHVNGRPGRPARRLVLARTSEGYRAFEDRCTHRGGSLADGVLICEVVQCLWHGSQFSVTDGAVKCGPAKEPIRVFPVRQHADGRLTIDAPPE